jgi:hypothetical protein
MEAIGLKLHKMKAHPVSEAWSEPESFGSGSGSNDIDIP